MQRDDRMAVGDWRKRQALAQTFEFDVVALTAGGHSAFQNAPLCRQAAAKTTTGPPAAAGRNECRRNLLLRQPPQQSAPLAFARQPVQTQLHGSRLLQGLLSL